MYSIRPANFLEQHFHQKPRSHRVLVLIALCVVLILGAVSIFALRSIVRIAEKTERAKDHLLYSMQLAQDQQFMRAREQVGSARVLLQEVARDVRPWKFTVVIPFVGRQVRAFDHTIATIDRLGSAFDRVLVFADRMVTTIVGNKPLHLEAITPEQRRLFLGQLLQAGPVLQGVKADVDLALLSLEKIPDRFLIPQLSNAVTPLKKNVPRMQRALTIALPLTEAIPLLSGYPNPQRYLFLFQNNDELRPTGGFIGTYGILELRDGEIASLFTDNIYRLDRLAEKKKFKVEAPAPVKKHLNVKSWFLRDSNWSPDFPTAARQALWFYQKESDDTRSIDGVIAVTPTVVVRLLELLGSITIDNVHFTPETLVDTLQYHVEKAYVDVGLPEVERKEIIGKLTKELIARVMQLPLQKIPDLLDVAQSALNERHILFYETNPDLQRIVTDEGWDGAMRTASGDYLMVVDANLSALKTDSVMERSIDYSVVPDAGRMKATVKIQYHNKGVFTWKTTRYRTYTRIYVPQGSTLIRSDGFITEDKKRERKRAETTEEFGRTVFNGFLIVEPKDKQTLTLEYYLPNGITSNGYTLYVQKQPGTEAHPLRVQLQFGRTVKEWQPTGFAVERKGGTIVFPTDLRVDRQFSIKF